MNEQHPADEDFLEAAHAELVRGAEHLDGATRSRLNRIRQQALARARPRRYDLLAPFGGLVTACVLVLALLVLDFTPERAPEPAGMEPLMEDLEMLSSGELEFYEDFEFYLWLAENGATI